MKVLASLFLIFLLVLSPFLALSPLTSIPKAEATVNWLTGWDYRKNHTIIQANYANINYTIGMKAYTGNGTDGNETVSSRTFGKFYCDNHCNANFSDVRFTTDDGSTLLNYFMYDYTLSTYGLFWVRIPDNLTTTDVTFYIYYGNSLVGDASDGNNTFAFFDNLGRYTLGDTPPAGLYAEVNPSNGNSSIMSAGGTNVWKISYDGGVTATYYLGAIIKDLGASYRYGYASYYDILYKTTATQYGVRFSGETLTESASATTIGGHWLYTYSGLKEFTPQTGNSSIETWYSMAEILDSRSASQYYHKSIDGIDYTGQVNAVTKKPDRCQWYFGAQLAQAFQYLRGTGYNDSFLFITTFVNPEPTHGTFGSTTPVPPSTNATTTPDFDPYYFTEKKFYTISQTATSITSIDVMQVKFSDGYNTFVMSYDNSSGTFSTNATDYLILEKHDSTATEYVSTNNYTIVVDYVFKLTEKVRDAKNIDLYTFVNNSVGSSGWVLALTDFCDIYNLGGMTEWASSGTAGLIDGGDTFEVYAYNNSWVAVNQTWYHWVHYHAQFSITLKEDDSIWDGINPQFWQDYGHLGVGDVIYADKGDWQIRATLYGFDSINKTYVIQSQCWLQMEIGDWGTTDRWTTLNATWLDKDGTVIRTDLFSAFIENDPRSEVRLYFDLWFNQINASTVNGGRLTAFYYGMHKNAYLWWGDWVAETGTHSLTNASISNAFMPNRDVDGNLAPAQDIELVKIGFNVSRPHTAENGPYQPDWAIRLTDFVISEMKVTPDQQVRGINTPVRVDTLIPNLPATGFWTPLYDAITKVGEYFVTALSAAAGFVWDQIGARWPWFTSFWDNVGLTVSTLFDYMTEIWGYFLGLITFAGNLLDPIRKIIDVFTTAYSYVQTMFGWIGGADLANLIIIMMIVMYFIPLMYAFQVGDLQSIKDLVVAPLHYAFSAMMWGFEMIKSLITWALEAIPL